MTQVFSTVLQTKSWKVFNPFAFNLLPSQGLIEIEIKILPRLSDSDWKDTFKGRFQVWQQILNWI